MAQERGWYPLESDPSQERWWNGGEWVGPPRARAEQPPEPEPAPTEWSAQADSIPLPDLSQQGITEPPAMVLPTQGTPPAPDPFAPPPAAPGASPFAPPPGMQPPGTQPPGTQPPGMQPPGMQPPPGQPQPGANPYAPPQAAPQQNPYAPPPTPAQNPYAPPVGQQPEPETSPYAPPPVPGANPYAPPAAPPVPGQDAFAVPANPFSGPDPFASTAGALPQMPGPHPTPGMTPTSNSPFASPAAGPAAGALPATALIMGAGGLALVFGAFLPWVTVASIFTVNGVSVHWGIATLIAGLVVLVVALGRGRIYTADQEQPLSIVAAVLGVGAIAVALYVGFAIRDSVAEAKSNIPSSPSTGTDPNANIDFGDAFEELFKVRTGFGVYITAIGGVLAAAGGIQQLRTKQ